MRSAIIGFSLALTLAACGSQGDEPTEPKTVIAPGAPDTASSTPSEIDGSMSNGGYPLANPSDLIPARYLGSWDYAEGTCSPESDLRVEISGKEIVFYESVGLATASRDLNNATYVTLAMEGEGEQWEQGAWLKLIDDDRHLTITANDPDQETDVLPLKRCPA